MKHLLSSAALLAGLLMPGAAVRAQEIKIGYVDSERILREAIPAKSAQAKLEAVFRQQQKELSDAAARIKAAEEKLYKDAPTLAEGERARRQRELEEQVREFERKRSRYEEEANQRRNEELAAVVDRANQVIRQIFDAEKYDLIVQEAVFHSKRIDITNRVIDALNASAAPAK